MLGDVNHKMFEPQLFHADNDMRKQVELFKGALVFAGHKRPGGMAERRSDFSGQAQLQLGYVRLGKIMGHNSGPVDESVKVQHCAKSMIGDALGNRSSTLPLVRHRTLEANTIREEEVPVLERSRRRSTGKTTVRLTQMVVRSPKRKRTVFPQAIAQVETGFQEEGKVQALSRCTFE